MDLNDSLKRLSDFVLNVKFDGEVGHGIFVDPTVLISRGDHTIILVGKDADGYNDVVTSIFEAIVKRGRPVSKKAVSDLVGDFLLRTLGNGDSTSNPGLGDLLQGELRELKTGLLEKPKSWDLILPVDGLAPSGLPITVGKTRFVHVDDAWLSEIKKRAADLIVESASPGSASFADKLSQDIEVLKGRSVGMLSVTAVDSDAAIQFAKNNLQTTLDAINFFSSREGIGGWVFLPGDAMPQTELVLAFCEDGRLTPSFRRAGPKRMVPLNQLASRKGFTSVSGILAKDAPSDIEERLLASLQWAGRAQVEARREEAFLLYAISLESLLLARETKTELSHRLAVRCAHLGGGTLADKTRIVSNIQALYDIRSKIVHSGNFVINDEDLELIREYAVLTIFIILDTEPFRSMGSVRQLEEWFDNQLLSGGFART